MADPRQVPGDAAAIFAALTSVKSAKSALEKQEKELKAQLFASVGITDDDPKPPSVVAVNPDGEPVYQVKVSYQMRLDTKYLKETHPHIYAECEKSIPVKSIKAAE